MARTCAKCGEGFGFQDVPFCYRDLFVHTRHFDTLNECDAYLKAIYEGPKLVDGEAEPHVDKQTIEPNETD